MHSPHLPTAPKHPHKRIRILVQVLLFLALLAAIIFLLLNRASSPSIVPPTETPPAAQNLTPASSQISPAIHGARLSASGEPHPTPEQIVSAKVAQFGAHRRQIVHALAERHGESIPEEVRRFFDAVEAGNWLETERLFKLMASRSGQYDKSGPADPALNHFWPAVLETFGVAEQVHNIPAHEVLKFGDDILDTLAPGAVYIGGTDSGRFIPTLLAETSNGPRPVVLTQNALIDDRYLDYIQFLYGDRLALPTQEDSRRIFADYSADAEKRLEHDEQFPNEPKQIRHLENIQRKDGKIDVGGSSAVMDLNERLLRLILERNPDLQFSLQESFPLKNTYAEAIPSGPIMQLRAQSDSDPLPASAASQSLDYWRNTASGISPESHSDEFRKNYSHMAGAHGNLLSHHGHTAAAEQTYQLSLQMYPRNIDSLINYHQFLLQNNRPSEATRLLDQFKSQHSDLVSELKKWLPLGD